jgi:hypothetical protein
MDASKTALALLRTWTIPATFRSSTVSRRSAVVAQCESLWATSARRFAMRATRAVFDRNVALMTIRRDVPVHLVAAVLNGDVEPVADVARAAGLPSLVAVLCPAAQPVFDDVPNHARDGDLSYDGDDDVWGDDTFDNATPTDIPAPASPVAPSQPTPVATSVPAPAVVAVPAAARDDQLALF